MTKPKQVQKKLRKYWENFFCNYALFYMQGVGIFTEITVHKILEIVFRPLDCGKRKPQRLRKYRSWPPFLQLFGPPKMSRPLTMLIVVFDFKDRASSRLRTLPRGGGLCSERRRPRWWSVQTRWRSSNRPQAERCLMKIHTNSCDRCRRS